MRQVPDEQKLTVTFRVEPGCLGPQGASHIEEFCEYAQQKFQFIEPGIILWKLIPRNDKSLDEMQYSISSKLISQDNAKKYFSMLDKDIYAFEEKLHETLSDLIEEYMKQ